jgi:hypothetical protein
MKKSIISEEKIKKFDDVHIKSMNLTGMVYAIKGNDVVVNTVKKGLVKAKLDDLKKIYTDSVNEADVIGKTIFSNGKGKLFFGYYKTDDAVEFVDYKTWKKLNFKDVSKGDFNKNRVIDSILRNQKQFNKKVDYNMWAKKTNPSFEEKMDWFIKNGWITNITKTGIKEGVESVNEGAMSDIDIIANEATDFKDFVKQFYIEYSDFPKNRESLKWLEDIYKGRTKMEGLERVASALPQTKEEPVTEGDEKSAEEILMGLRQMAMGDLERIEDYAEMISDRMEQGQELSSWMYSQITLAVDQLNSVHDAMDGNDGVKESVNEHNDCGCGCNGVTEGGCNTSLKEEKLNEWRAEEVLQQLGGRKFIAMTGAKNFVKNDKEKSITFKIGGGAKNSINYVKITLTSMDVYNVDFIKVRGTDIKTIATAKGVYNDQLQSIFTKYTGLYTSL